MLRTNICNMNWEYSLIMFREVSTATILQNNKYRRSDITAMSDHIFKCVGPLKLLLPWSDLAIYLARKQHINRQNLMPLSPHGEASLQTLTLKGHARNQRSSLECILPEFIHVQFPRGNFQMLLFEDTHFTSTCSHAYYTSPLLHTSMIGVHMSSPTLSWAWQYYRAAWPNHFKCPWVVTSGVHICTRLFLELHT